MLIIATAILYCLYLLSQSVPLCHLRPLFLGPSNNLFLEPHTPFQMLTRHSMLYIDDMLRPFHSAIFRYKFVSRSTYKSNSSLFVISSTSCHITQHKPQFRSVSSDQISLLLQHSVCRLLA